MQGAGAGAAVELAGDQSIGSGRGEREGEGMGGVCSLKNYSKYNKHLRRVCESGRVTRKERKRGGRDGEWRGELGELA